MPEIPTDDPFLRRAREWCPICHGTGDKPSDVPYVYILEACTACSDTAALLRQQDAESRREGWSAAVDKLAAYLSDTPGELAQREIETFKRAALKEQP